jgi:ADP-ribose pyrophosphatase
MLGRIPAHPALAKFHGAFQRSRPACASNAKILGALAYIDEMPKSSRSSKPKRARVVSRRVVHRGPVFWVTSERVIEPSGIRVLREVVRHTGSVVVLATTDGPRQPHVLLERQYRHAADSFLWELPAGRIDKGERPLAAAKRELLEETGYKAKQWKQILKFYASPGFVAEQMSLFWARGLEPGPAQPEEDEAIEQHLVPLSKAVRMVLKGDIRDAKTISGVLWLALHARHKRR